MDNKEVNIADNESKEDRGKIKKNKVFWLAISITFFVLSIILVLLAYKIIADYQRGVSNSFKLSLNQPDSAKDSAKNFVRRNIDGVYVEPGKENLFPLAVVIDNHPDSYPPAGLAQANLVYEAEVEGGITRYLAFFASGENIDAIGPIRSARPYFIDWTHELSALFVHCGGSPEALVKIAKDDILDLNEFYNGDYFWRAKDRLAPHNVITSTENLRNYLNGKDLTEGKFFSWNFKDDTPFDNAINTEISIPKFVVKWMYNKENNDYVRYLRDTVQKDCQGQEIRAKNVIIAFIKSTVIDEELRLRMETIGSGEAIVCLDGACRKGEWRKKSASSRMRFYNTSGEEFIFNAGNVWIEVARPGYNVTY